MNLIWHLQPLAAFYFVFVYINKGIDFHSPSG